jgi:hypothetical protein
VSKKIRKRKKRVRAPRISERHQSVQATDELRGRIAARVCLLGGVAMLVGALLLSYLMPSWNHALGVRGNVALRIAGIALVIASMLFSRLGK